mmetsp:Transcript_20583/g.59736  ORF Transcript_20583/g.59736 Transcript_20583/m.59736 type:complete len:1251 (-) Transcript_20583:552-4304(-)
MPPVEESKDGEEEAPLASFGETFSFGGESRRKTPCLVLGLFCAAVTGCVYPAMAFFFAQVFETLGADSSSADFMANVRTMAWTFMILGAVALTMMTIQNGCLEIVSNDMTVSLKKTWFEALLRQDMAYFDMKDVSGTATIISSNSMQYKKGVGRKLGEGVQFTLTMLGGFAYAFWASWKTSLVVLAVLPLMAIAGVFVLKVTQSQTARANENYAEAGSIAYTLVSAVKTVLSLNACRTMIEKYNAATEKAFRAAAGYMPIVGCANGSMMGSFIVSYLLLTLFGSYLLYDAVRKTGCDPSGVVTTNTVCDPSAMDVFGALMGMTFGAVGLPQISTAIEALQGARQACYPAIEAMNRKRGEGVDDPENAIVAKKNEKRRGSVALPKYVIDSSSSAGMKPSDTKGNIHFENVSFSYPTRSEAVVLNGMSLNVEAGKTLALVGPSGSGKSSVVGLIERFYDPRSGAISLDGNDLRDLNVKWLRRQIGLVSQEPVLFARSIKENIAYGCRGNVSQEEIENAAKLANAHDFIMGFQHGYETEVGDRGAQLSGGQKQRICLSRVLIANPKVLLLDEATSALDSESEHIVQRALDKLLESSKRTTIVIAHRLSTIKNADQIAVIDGGRVLETGTHETLMQNPNSKYKQLVEAQGSGRSANSNEQLAQRNSSFLEAKGDLENDSELPQICFRDVHFSYPTRRENAVFRGLDLSVRQGETIALVGPSGGGKSTIVQLIERFYDPDSGIVELEGTDLKYMNVEWLRDQIGLVSQEPTLFNTTVAGNIRYGCPNATQAQIEEAAMQANAHDFIMEFPDGYDTLVGERGAQVSGGQKQRISIARALIKRPKILLFDEATSALDTQSERVVQEALDKVMSQRAQTIVVIAHRLSTIKNADRIAVIDSGRVREIGTHDVLMSTDSHYKRLQKYQSMDASHDDSIKPPLQSDVNTLEKPMQDEEVELDDDSISGEELSNQSEKRARVMAKEDAAYLCVGAIGAVFAGLVFPSWGIVFAYMIELLYNPVFFCDDSFLVGTGYESCDAYYNSEADNMQNLSFKISYGWLGLIGSTVIGNILLFYGFGTASERMSKRVRDAAFDSLVRQEPAFFDKRSVGSITTQLQDDAALIHSFSGEPIRTLIMNISSVLVGLVISFIYMWPFALLTLGILPFMAFGAIVEMKMYMGEDHVEEEEDEHSPGAIVVETLLSIRTVASLTIESKRLEEYSNALTSSEPTIVACFSKGAATGLGFFIQCWGMYKRHDQLL